MNEQSSSTSVVVELEKQKVSFLDNSIDLKRLLKDISRHSRTAIDVLLKVLTESKDEKILLTAAKTLLELQVSVAKEINTDQMQRLIAEVKLNNGSNKLVEVDQDNRPLVDFTTIREID